MEVLKILLEKYSSPIQDISYRTIFEILSSLRQFILVSFILGQLFRIADVNDNLHNDNNNEE